jgi:hypothetical protein
MISSDHAKNHEQRQEQTRTKPIPAEGTEIMARDVA